MICQNCKKRKATVHLTEVINGDKHEKHLCEQCASEEEVALKSPEQIQEVVKQFVSAQQSAENLGKLTCPECGITFMEFRKSGLLGCPNDYEIFAEALSALIERAHEGRRQHVGKCPNGRENKRKRQHQLMKIMDDLEQAVAIEDYELAAQLRDQLKLLEKR